MILISDAWSSPAVISAVVSLIIAAGAYLKAHATDSKIGDVHQVITSDVTSLKRDKADALQKVASLTGTPDAQEAAARAQNNYVAQATTVASLRDVSIEDVQGYNAPVQEAPPIVVKAPKP